MRGVGLLASVAGWLACCREMLRCGDWLVSVRVVSVGFQGGMARVSE